MEAMIRKAAATVQKNASENQSGDLTFADLAKYSFEFCSGAGGWSTDFEIEKRWLFQGILP